MKHAAFIFLLPWCMVSCTKDKALAPVQSVVCDTVQPGYARCIQPILKAYCYVCHSDSASAGGSTAFDIENFGSLKTYLMLYYHNDSIYGSKFMHVIEQTQGVIYMPPTGKLPANDIALLQAWINTGAPQN
jgi:hypothetical protein